MKYLFESLSQVFGNAPTRLNKADQPQALKDIYRSKIGTLNKADLEAARQEHQGSFFSKWRKRRWITLIVVNVLFLVSYKFDVQLLEGAMTASRFVGFHFADLNSAFQVMLAYKHVVLNLLIGTTTVFIMWLLLGGRTFCSWVCPYHLLAEWAEMLHVRLADRKIIKNITFHRKTRSVFYLIFAVLALISGYTVFETISPTGILSRALIYGPGVALIWVGLLLLFEIFVSRRAWCRYVCPIGVTYGVVGAVSPLRITYNAEACHHEGDCRKICEVPHVLDLTIRGRAHDINQDVTSDCTRCGMCVDVCPTSSLNFSVKGLDKFL